MIQLFYDRVLIKRKAPEETVRGGIIVPDIAKSRPQEGEVIAVGPGRWDGTCWREPQVRVGDQVLFSKYAGIELKLPEDYEGDYIILRDEDVLGKLACIA